jgi:hypothetical protein
LNNDGFLIDKPQKNLKRKNPDEVKTVIWAIEILAIKLTHCLA